MITASLLDRLRRAVDAGEVYLTPANSLPDRERQHAHAVMERAAVDGPVAAYALVDRLRDDGMVSRVAWASIRHVLAASPQVRDHREAARMAELQEHYALEEGGELLQARLASVDRHRGVLAFLRGHPALALDWFSRAFERQRTPENLGNVLAALVADGAREEANELLDTVREGFPQAFVTELVARIQADDDLADLR